MYASVSFRSSARTRCAGVLAAVLLLTAWAAGQPAGAQDVDYHERVAIELVDSPGGLQMQADVRVEKTVLSERAAEADLFDVVPDPFYATIRNLRGSVNGEPVPDDHVTSTTAQPRNVFISGLRLHRIRTDRTVRPGDSVTYSYVERYADPSYAPILRVPNVNRLAGYDVVVDHPHDVRVDFEAFVPGDDVEYTVDRPRPTRTTLRVDTLDRRTARPFDPHAGLQAAFLPIFSRDGEPFTPAPTGRFVRWYRDLIPDYDPLTAAEQAFVDSLVQDAASATDSLRALYEFARTDVRYIADEDSVNTIVPRSPQEVVRRRYGDCKDKAHFVAQTARAMGMDVHMALVSTSPSLPFDYEHVQLYNHVIIAARTGDDESWTFLDPTHRYLPYGDLPESDVGRRALILDPDDPQRIFIPPPSGAPSLQVDVETTLADPGTGTARVTLRHDLFAAALRAKETQTAVAFENQLSQLVNDWLYRMTIDRFRVVETGERTMTLAAEADLGDFVIASPTRRYVPKTPFQVVASDVLDRTGDAAPLVLPYSPPMTLTLNVGTEGFEADASRFRLGSPPASGSEMTDSTAAGSEAAGSEAGGSASAGEATPDDRLHGIDARVVPDSASARIRYRYQPFPRRPAGEVRTRYLDFADAYLDAKSDMFIFSSTDSKP